MREAGRVRGLAPDQVLHAFLYKHPSNQTCLGGGSCSSLLLPFETVSRGLSANIWIPHTATVAFKRAAPRSFSYYVPLSCESDPWVQRAPGREPCVFLFFFFFK